MKTPTAHRSAVAAEVRAALARDGRTATALAIGSGISRGALSRKMNAETPFTVDELLAVAAVLDISPGSLIVTAERTAAHAA